MMPTVLSGRPPDGGYAVTGWPQSFGERGLHVWVLKHKSEGDVLHCQDELIEETDVIPYNTNDIRKLQLRQSEEYPRLFKGVTSFCYGNLSFKGETDRAIVPSG
jgi:hypothetical protein